MSKHAVYSIGRSQDADLRLDDDSISRLHGELALTADGRFFYTDCCSSGGSHVLQGDKWVALQQAYVDKTATLRLGQFQTTVQDLALLIHEFNKNKAKKPGNGPEWSSKDDLPSGPVRRDSATGEILGREDT